MAIVNPLLKHFINQIKSCLNALKNVIIKYKQVSICLLEVHTSGLKVRSSLGLGLSLGTEFRIKFRVELGSRFCIRV